MQEPTLDPEILGRWIGHSETVAEPIAVKQARLMQTTLDREASLSEGDALPALWHWIYFFPVEVPLSGLGRDGHPKLGGFLPPVALPRRMWAGGRLSFAAPLQLGESVERHSTIRSVAVKEGRSGPLCFVTVEHRYHAAGEPRMVEEHDIVYREDPSPDAPAPKPKPAPGDSAWRQEARATPVQLFRYSALTFNGHRIHYDRDYCRDVEGYPGLVVHGPLTGTLLAELAQAESGRSLAAFTFRALSPLFDTAAFVLAGRPEGDGATLWAETPEGGLAMTAEATFAARHERSVP